MKQYEHKPTITKYLNNLNLKFTKLRSTDPGPWHTDECSPEVKHIHMSVREAMLLIMCTLNIRLYILICAVKGPESLLVPLLDAKGTAAQRLLIGPCIHFIEICLKRKWTRVSRSLARSLSHTVIFIPYQILSILLHPPMLTSDLSSVQPSVCEFVFPQKALEAGEDFRAFFILLLTPPSSPLSSSSCSLQRCCAFIPSMPQ